MDMNLFLDVLKKVINSQFIIQSDEYALKKIDEIKPEGLTDTFVLRIQRNRILQTPSKPLNYWRTIIVTELASKIQLESALQWAASAKEILLDPESADLYMFIIFKNNVNISIETCIRIESTEQFCRKYVARPGESPEDLISRTFLTSLDDFSKSPDIPILDDPIDIVFSSLKKDFLWFNATEQKNWRENFLSGKSGSEIINTLFNYEL